MRIYFGAYWFLPASVGLINELSKHHRLFVVTTVGAARDVGSRWREVIEPAVPVRVETRIKLKNPLYWWHRAVGVWQATRRFGCDLIHVQETLDPFLIWLLLRQRRYPLVLTVHDPVPHLGEEETMKYYSSRRPLVEALRRHAGWIITPGQDTRRQLLEAYPDLCAERVTAIAHGPRDFYLRWQQSEWTEQPGTVLFFGRINAYKGLGVLLEAWERIKPLCPQAKLIIAGRGHDLHTYRERINKDPQCELIDRFIPSEQVAELFTRCSIVVLPYVEATQSGVLATAIAFGKPAVVTRTGSLPEMVEDGQTGFVVEPNNAQALADALLRLLQDDTLRERMSHHVRQLAQGSLSWQTRASETCKVYQQAIEYHRTAGK
ncbi:MAG: glycosyltransferase family 4 protein [Armatimonadota bacterium]